MRDKRCVHLDFHTSERIEGIGKYFDAEDFKANLKKAGLDSITLFAKCHHGCFYYEDTKFFKHPHLCCSLLDEQVKACKEAGVSAKIYISAGFDEYTARQHPEWLWRNEKVEANPDTAFRRLCFNTPYMELLVAQTEEVVRKYMPDGVFFDIMSDWPCYCESCMEDMAKMGMDPNSKQDHLEHGKIVLGRYAERLEKAVHAIKPDCLIFQNGGNFPVGRRDRMDCCDQLETESLPTGGWGYDHVPLSMAYLRRQGKNCIGMTGKFHRSWGEFGAFKYKEALKYEAAQCLALDAGFCVGDQMHPNAFVDSYTYESIGYANAYIKEREAWRGGEYIAEAAMYSPKGGDGRIGLSRILFEEKILFDLIDEKEISNRYKVIFLCDDEELTDSEYKALKEYVAKGGKLMAMGRNITYKGATAFDLGAVYQGEDKETPCYIQANYTLQYADGMALVAYEKSYNVEVTGKVLANKLSPYFTRRGLRFCSHQHTPYDLDKKSAAITEGADGIYLASNLFTQYAKDGSLTARQLIAPLLDRLLGERTVITSLPTSGKAALYHKDGKTICHLWYANTIKRGNGVEIVEDIVTLSKVSVSIKCENAPKEVLLQPTGEKVAFVYENGRVSFDIKDFNCYQIIELA